ncbi:MAG: cupin domain-containing protein [Pseudomonadota bacterium]
MSERYRFLEPGGGVSYDWSADHTFVKTSAADTGGAYALMEDNLKPQFALGLHLHRQHAETFYILEGAVDFHVDGDWMTAETGACLHIPPGVPHACLVSNPDVPTRMLMVFQPAGFDQYLAALAALSQSELDDPAVMDALNARFDIVALGPVPSR